MRWPTSSCLQTRSVLALAAIEKKERMPMNAMWVTSELWEINFLLLMFWHGCHLLPAYRLGDADRHMMPSQCCVDVDMEESVVQTLHSVQKPCNLQHIIWWLSLGLGNRCLYVCMYACVYVPFLFFYSIFPEKFPNIPKKGDVPYNMLKNRKATFYKNV